MKRDKMKSRKKFEGLPTNVDNLKCYEKGVLRYLSLLKFTKLSKDLHAAALKQWNFPSPEPCLDNPFEFDDFCLTFSFQVFLECNQLLYERK